MAGHIRPVFPQEIISIFFPLTLVHQSMRIQIIRLRVYSTLTRPSTRQMTTSSASDLRSRVSIPPDHDRGAIVDKLEHLVSGFSSPTWLLVNEGKGVQRKFRFKTFKQTWVCSND